MTMQIDRTSRTEEVLCLWIREGHLRIAKLLNQALWGAGYYFIDSRLEQGVEIWEYRRRAVPFA